MKILLAIFGNELKVMLNKNFTAEAQRVRRDSPRFLSVALRLLSVSAVKTLLLVHYPIFVFITMWQSACTSKVELPQNSEVNLPFHSSTPYNIAPSKTIGVDLKNEEIEAQKLLESGLSFDFTANADGVTSDGGIYTGHGYKSSDGIEISTQVALYREEKNAKRDFEDTLKSISKFLKREFIYDEGKIKIGERVVAISKNSDFLVLIKVGQGCKFYYSYSLKHLLAFEKWRARE